MLHSLKKLKKKHMTKENLLIFIYNPVNINNILNGGLVVLGKELG